ncbi:uncharacterized protein VSU04_012358 [Chlamydotis macqueenii]
MLRGQRGDGGAAPQPSRSQPHAETGTLRPVPRPAPWRWAHASRRALSTRDGPRGTLPVPGGCGTLGTAEENREKRRDQAAGLWPRPPGSQPGSGGTGRGSRNRRGPAPGPAAAPGPRCPGGGRTAGTPGPAAQPRARPDAAPGWAAQPRGRSPVPARLRAAARVGREAAPARPGPTGPGPAHKEPRPALPLPAVGAALRGWRRQAAVTPGTMERSRDGRPLTPRCRSDTSCRTNHSSLSCNCASPLASSWPDCLVTLWMNQIRSSGTPRLHLRIISAIHPDPERYTYYGKLVQAGIIATGNGDGLETRHPNMQRPTSAGCSTLREEGVLLGCIRLTCLGSGRLGPSHAAACTQCSNPTNPTVQKVRPLHIWSKNSGNKVIATYSSLHFCLLRQTN